MKLNEAEMRMAYQIESTDPNAVLNEIYMTWRLSKNQATRDTAESLMAKLRPLSNKECMDLIREVQANYRLPGKPQTIGEMLAEARQKSGAQKLAEAGYGKALENQEKGFIRIRNHAKVRGGDLFYDRRDREL